MLAREGEFLVEFARHEPVIHSRTIPGFHVHRAWLNPTNLPPVADCLKEITAA